MDIMHINMLMLDLLGATYFPSHVQQIWAGLLRIEKNDEDILLLSKVSNKRLMLRFIGLFLQRPLKTSISAET
jgi:hypothetical protein